MKLDDWAELQKVTLAYGKREIANGFMRPNPLMNYFLAFDTPRAKPTRRQRMVASVSKFKRRLHNAWLALKGHELESEYD